MNALKIIVQAFLEICLLRKGPQDIPASSLFFGICAGAYALSSLLLATAYQDFNNAVITALADSGLTILITCVLLIIVSLKDGCRRSRRCWEPGLYSACLQHRYIMQSLPPEMCNPSAPC